VYAYQDYASKYGIAGINALASIPPLTVPSGHPSAREPITEDFIEQVRSALPRQPWKPGIHRKITAQLKCNNSEYSAAVEYLIENGVFLRQRDGVLYDGDGNMVSFDTERVDPETLELLAEKS
jgi:hypothetical protein